VAWKPKGRSAQWSVSSRPATIVVARGSFKMSVVMTAPNLLAMARNPEPFHVEGVMGSTWLDGANTSYFTINENQLVLFISPAGF
jgi:hypothetical protein